LIAKSRYLLLSAAFLFLISGLILRNWELISLLFPITLFVALSYLLNHPPSIALKVERSLESSRVLEGDSLRVDLTIENIGEPLSFVQFKDEIPEGTVVEEGRPYFPLTLGTGEKVEVGYRITFPVRGKYQLGPATVRWTDPTWTCFQEGKFDGSSEISVIPHIHEIKKCDLHPTKMRMHTGNVSSRILGHGSEFHCLRQYYSGDETRRINWKASGRMDSLMTNEYESERSGDVTIVLDARMEIEVKNLESGVIDAGVEAAASLSKHFLKERNRVGAILLGDVVDIVRPAYGKKQFYRIVDHLLRTRAGVQRSTLGIKMAMKRYFPMNSMVIVVTPLGEEGIINTIRELVARGHQVVVVSPSPLDVEARGMETSEEVDSALRLARILRDDSIRDLRRYCQVIDWDAVSPLSRYLMEVAQSAIWQTG
jgi:uncharacterized protein (DUF58 family)